MTIPNIKQGGYRSKPDGFLHLNNFAHSMKSGMAGAIYERILTRKQQDTFCELMVELATSEMATQAEFKQLYHFKHGVYRFDKDFLIQHFKRMFYGYMKLINRSPSAVVAMATTGELIDVAQNGGIAKVKFK